VAALKQDAVRDIKDRLDLVDLVSEHLRLQKAGRDLKGLCPFHSEKTPSFYVSPEKQLWHCYGCQKGGDHFTFIEDIEHVDFKAALRLLADKTGVVLEESPGAGRQRDLKKTIERLNGMAAQYFHHILLENPAGRPALIQLESRGVTRQSMSEFLLGFAPAGQHKDNLVRFLRKHGVTDRDMVDAGLALTPHPDPPPQGGRDLWDRFRQRIMIPIHDEHGELVGFGGRVIDDNQQPKYLNTSQTALYDKGRTLFNLFRARKAIREEKHAVLMEGYFDAITAWQAGVTNVVTTSGTALTEHQVRLLKRETQELLLAFDRDDAGMSATQRAIELASKSGIYIKVVRVPQGKDPDDYLRANPDGWGALREHALPEWEYLLRQAVAGLELTDAEDRRRGVELVIPVLAKIPEASVLEIYAQMAAGWLRIDAAALLRDVQSNRVGSPQERLKRSHRTDARLAWAGGPRPSPATGGGSLMPQGGGRGKDEAYLLGLLMERPDLIKEMAPTLPSPASGGARNDSGGEDLQLFTPVYERLFQRLRRMVEEDPAVVPIERMAEFERDEQALISAVAMTRYPELETGSEAALRLSLEQCVQTLKINARERRLRALGAALRNAETSDERNRLAAEYHNVSLEKEAIKELRSGAS
jgi:DNA primase